MLQKLKTLYEKHNTTINIVFAIITVASTIFAVYTYLNPINIDPKLAVIIDDENIFLVRSEKKVKDLVITYKGRELGENNQSLVIKKITIKNLGKAPVRLNDYSQNDFKIKIFNGKLIATEPLVSKDNKLLSISLKPRIADSVTVALNKQVFNSGEAVSFNVYILVSAKTNKNLDYYVLGKIAGQDTIPVIFENEFKSEDGFLDTIAWILGMIGLIVGLGVVIVTLDNLIEMIKEKIKKNYILKIYGFPLKELNSTQIVFVNLYKYLKKKDFLALMNDLSKNPNYINEQEKCCEAIEIYRKNYDNTYGEVRNSLYKNDLIKKEDNNVIFVSETLKDEAIRTLRLFS